MLQHLLCDVFYEIYELCFFHIFFSSTQESIRTKVGLLIQPEPRPSTQTLKDLYHKILYHEECGKQLDTEKKL